MRIDRTMKLSLTQEEENLLNSCSCLVDQINVEMTEDEWDVIEENFPCSLDEIACALRQLIDFVEMREGYFF